MVHLFGFPISIVDMTSILGVAVLFTILRKGIRVIMNRYFSPSTDELVQGFRTRLKSLDGKGPFSHSKRS